MVAFVPTMKPLNGVKDEIGVNGVEAFFIVSEIFLTRLTLYYTRF